MTLEELVKNVRLELSEAVGQDKQGHPITSRACLGQVYKLLGRYLGDFERYAGGNRKPKN